MNIKTNSLYTYITTEAFVHQLLSEDLSTAYKNGILNDFDLIHKDADIKRNQAARILYHYLRLQKKEADLSDWSAAEQLKDLYFCKTCVRHIAQVYAKGIMSARAGQLFQPQETLFLSETEEILEKIFDPTKRTPPEKPDLPKLSQISLQAAEKILMNGGLLIDVRDTEEADKNPVQMCHPSIARLQIPLKKIELNPYQVPKGRPLVLYCDYGYKSTRAARILMQHHYGKEGMFLILPQP